jgi:tetratricopeptide (TPR) repeat protein
MIGPYKLLQQIGEGGMGAVWLAEQSQPVSRKVALKIIKPGTDRRQVLARFEAERQALALMEHPNIAKVLDGGTTPDGRPYFVMELVKGEPITKYCDEHRLTPRQRLELFVPVCQAIQHAHQKGIIHRDIKPSNVLIAPYDGTPVVKVIDFGVAKATGQRLTERTLFTEFGAVVGTLEYMSPEQAELNNNDIDTRSDIYSLGVLLYELLTGTTPLNRKSLKQAALVEMLRKIREEEPPKPSTRLSSTEELPNIAANRGLEPKKLSGLVRGELDWIVMKALEKDRNRRYETASGFAMDVQRYLADEPVLACPPSAGYRLRKFIRRNKGGLAVAGIILFFMLLLGGGIGYMVRDRAARQLVVEQEVSRALDEASKWQEQEKWSEALSAVKRAEGLLAGGSGTSELHERAKERRKDVEMVMRLEAILFDLTSLKEDPARFDFVQPDYQYALAFREYGIDVDALQPAEAAQQIQQRSIRLQLAMALDGWAEARRYSGTRKKSWQHLLAVARAADPDRWRNRLREALQERRQKELAEVAAAVPIGDVSPVTLGLLGRALMDAGAQKDAEAILRQAQRRHPSSFWLNYDLAMSLIRQQPRQLHDGIGFLRAALALRPNSPAVYAQLTWALQESGVHEEVVALQQEAVRLQTDTAWMHAYHARALLRMGQYDEATAAYRKAVELAPKYISAHIGLGLALADQKKLDEAIACYQKAIELDAKCAAAHVNLGIALANQKKLDEATACYQTAIELDPKCAAAHINLGVALADQKKLDEAIACFRKAVKLDPKLAAAQYNLGNALFGQQKIDQAITSYQKAIELDPKHAAAHVSLGYALYGQKKLDEAVACYTKAIELDPKNALAHHNFGLVLYGQKKLDAAIACFQKAVELDARFVHGHVGLGIAFAHQKKLHKAIAAYRKAIELDPKCAAAHINLGAVLCVDLKKYEEAAACYKKAMELEPKNTNAHYNLGVALYELRKPDEAIACWRKTIELDSQDARAHYLLGVALQGRNKLDEAIACYRKVIKLAPKDYLAHNDLAWLYATCADERVRNAKEAVMLAKKAIELAPAQADYNTLGVAQYRAGNWKEAIAALETSQRRKGGDSSDWFFLAMAHWQLGDKQQARKWYDQAVQWMDKNQPEDEELRRFRDEAAQLLGVAQKK